MGDLISEMLNIEAKATEFAKTASERIYGNYLNLARRADGYEFCNITDAYSNSQTIRNIFF